MQDRRGITRSRDQENGIFAPVGYRPYMIVPSTESRRLCLGRLSQLTNSEVQEESGPRHLKCGQLKLGPTRAGLHENWAVYIIMVGEKKT